MGSSKNVFPSGKWSSFAQSKGFEEIIMDEVDDIKLEMSRKVGESVQLAYNLNVSLINGLWTIASGRRLHSQQQEFLSVYECIDKITNFMSQAAIMSFVPLLSKLLPERVTKMEKRTLLSQQIRCHFRGQLFHGTTFKTFFFKT